MPDASVADAISRRGPAASVPSGVSLASGASMASGSSPASAPAGPTPAGEPLGALRRCSSHSAITVAAPRLAWRAVLTAVLPEAWTARPAGGASPRDRMLQRRGDRLGRIGAAGPLDDAQVRLLF